MSRKVERRYQIEVRRFHAPLWKRRRAEGVSEDALCQSLVRLYLQGYGDTEIAAMFGVSRERVRQWRSRFGLDAFKSSVQGTLVRVWDEGLDRFRPLVPEEVRRRERAERARQRATRRLDRRRQMLAALRDLEARLNRLPTLSELATALGTSVTSIAWAWREPSDVTSYKEAFQRLYLAAGWIAPALGSGLSRHLLPQTVATIRTLYSRGNVTIAALARQFDVAYRRVWRIVRGRAYRDVGRRKRAA